MSRSLASPEKDLPQRPLPGTYWIVPGRFLVGEHPAAATQADTLERLSRLLTAGFTCFIDLTEPRELPSYEALLPFALPGGRRLEYRREPIPDHSVPEGREQMSRILAALDAALEVGHRVYVHCRAGIGRSAMVAGCWLAEHPAATGEPLVRLQRAWQQSARSRSWLTVPETDEQVEFVRSWALPPAAGSEAAFAPDATASDIAGRIRGALLGLALGDATGESLRSGSEAQWTQHTSLALCLAESLLTVGWSEARDQIDRYVRWQREGHLAADGRPGQPTPDVARALGAYQWRRKALAGSHDPADRTTGSLPRVVSAAAFEAVDPAAAVALSAECSRTTHQSPVVLDACRYFGAMLAGALAGTPRGQILRGEYEPVAGLWAARPLRDEVAAAVRASARRGRQAGSAAADVVHALVNVRAAVAAAEDVPAAIRAAIDSGREPALDGALAGALAGALFGPAAVLADDAGRLARLDLLEDFAARLAARALAAGRPRPEPRP